MEPEQSNEVIVSSSSSTQKASLTVAASAPIAHAEARPLIKTGSTGPFKVERNSAIGAADVQACGEVGRTAVARGHLAGLEGEEDVDGMFPSDAMSKFNI